MVERSILTLVRTFKIPAQPAITTSEDYFRQAGVTWMGDAFRINFLGLSIGAVEETEITLWKLEAVSLDSSILFELGSKGEISVFQFRQFLMDKRENSDPFLFLSYLEEKGGNPLVAHSRWCRPEQGWDIDACSVNEPDGWGVGTYILSR